MPHEHRDIANLDACARLIRAAGKTLAGYDPDQLVRLEALHAEVAAAMTVAIAGMRDRGVYWATIGEALGVTKEAVIMRYGPAVLTLKERGA